MRSTRRRGAFLSTILGLMIAGSAAGQTMTFDDADTDGDGALSQEEISAAFGADLVSRILAAEDANGDGLLSRAEAENALAADADWRDYDGPDVPDVPAD